MARIRIPVALDRRVRSAADHRCGYCLSPQYLVMARLEIEHIIPIAKGGTNDEANLWLACPLCNRCKGDLTHAVDPLSGETVALFHPRTQHWFTQFRWSEDGLRILGQTPTGRATVAALHLDDVPDAVTVRSYWVLAGWHPPTR